MLGVVSLLVSSLLAPSASAPAPGVASAPAPSATSATSVVDTAAPAASPSRTETPSRRIHFGLEARADLWRHPLRSVVGVEAGRFDLSLVTDPGIFVDGKSDVDLLLGWWVAPRAWQLSIGYRNSSMPIAGGRRFDEALLLGLDAAMPLLSGKHVRATFGLLVVADLVRHGGDVPVHTIPTRIADLADYVSIGFNARFEYALGF
jgi:hypothetical protein